ncbi:MAG: tetraacyldisaccharide 4'-kinase [Chiayiivirga sp.]|uniref:tetraacyldisaccharide 4'-kinase n=1 Tax=Chiayiivirga sp. TaxID=2041042 RepID=UPI0025BDBE8B|nr:tetraacyldisaccharide 4'-kinase [Chiayiivirga sp.]MCI1709668.1 tetraacyldisaccharide 4'-kinase [Chiayiivirga sp.]MCI1730043.1 tetraacyldisaccharide 4'-kinase [Chiayiivirga sp.]
MKTAAAQSVLAWLEQRWYGGVQPEWPLRCLARLYAAEAARRRRRFLANRASMPRVSLPTLVVGNLTIGGAGKTPLTLALIEALRSRGWKPGVVSRGYGGSATGPERVLAGSDPARVGDEPCLIAARSGAPVAIARRRVEAARLLEASHEVDVLIADDGLQHYALARDLEVLVIDGRRRFGNGAPLPAGPLRDAVARAESCDFRVVNGGEAGDGEVAMRLEQRHVVPLAGGTAQPLSGFEGQRVHAVAGIGDPSRFFAALRGHGIEVVPHPFPDHHAFRAGDFAFKERLPILMTEKDAVKCRRLALPEACVVPVDAILPASFFADIDARLHALPRDYR